MGQGLNHPTFSDAKYKDILTITLESLQGSGFTALSFKPLFFQGVYDKLFRRQQTAGRQKNNAPLYSDPYNKIKDLDPGFKNKFITALTDAQRNYFEAGGKDWRPIKIISTARNNVSQTTAMLDMLFDEQGNLLPSSVIRQRDFLKYYVTGKTHEEIFRYIYI